MDHGCKNDAVTPGLRQHSSFIGYSELPYHEKAVSSVVSQARLRAPEEGVHGLEGHIIELTA